MKKPRIGKAVSVLAILAGLTGPGQAGSEDVVIADAWARATIGMSRPGAVYLTLRNTGEEAVTVTGLATPLAITSEIHQTTTNANGVSSMAPAGEITIATGGSIALEPGGLHAMLMQLQEPLTEGETLPLIVIFSDGGEVTVEVPILGFAARGPED